MSAAGAGMSGVMAAAGAARKTSAEFSGAAQHGLPTLRVADLVQDTKTLRVAQDEAKALLAKDPNLIDPAHRALSDEVERLFETAGAMN